MKIGIYGGSFNPPHNSHKSLAQQLISHNYVDKVIFEPTGNKYNKIGLEDSIHRYNMLKLMIEGNPNFEITDYDLKETLVYTYQALDHFKKEYPHDEIYFICGSDNLIQFNTWKNYEYILNNYKILIVKRENIDISELLNKYKNIIETDVITETLSSTYIRNNIDYPNIKNYLSPKVYKYIKDNKLYDIGNKYDII